MTTGISGISHLTGGNCTRAEYNADVAHETAVRATGWLPWYEQPGGIERMRNHNGRPLGTPATTHRVVQNAYTLVQSDHVPEIWYVVNHATQNVVLTASSYEEAELLSRFLNGITDSQPRDNEQENES